MYSFAGSPLRAAFVAASVALAAAAVATPARAILVYDTSALGELTGSRSIADPGVKITGGTVPSSFTIAWQITPSGPLWQYKYTYTFASGVNDISHVILDLSDDCTATGTCVTGASYPNQNGVALAYDTFDVGPGNPNMMGPIKGIKFDETVGASGFMITFLSDRNPVYGDFYTKAGSTNGWQAQNTGIDRHATSETIQDFVARPDTQIVAMAEPGTLAAFGLGLLGLAAVRRRRAAS